MFPIIYPLPFAFGWTILFTAKNAFQAQRRISFAPRNSSSIGLAAMASASVRAPLTEKRRFLQQKIDICKTRLGTNRHAEAIGGKHFLGFWMFKLILEAISSLSIENPKFCSLLEKNLMTT